MDRLLYGINEQDDRFLYAGMLEHKLDDFVRGAVLQMHTAIENILDGTIENTLLGVRPRRYKAFARAARTVRGRTLIDLLEGERSLSFAQNVRLARALGIIKTQVTKQLAELNKIRNACSHHWLLNVRVRRNRKRSNPKLPLITYRGRSLHQVSVFEDFVGEFGGIYERLYAVYNGLRL